MQPPLVSLIITTYNRFDLLCRAIDSVLSQTYKNIEIIVVDDCSSDGTEEKIKKYSESICYIRNRENVGLSASRNVGIRASCGDFVSFLDDDDQLLPGKIENQINIFSKDTGIDVVYCGSIKKYKNSIIENLPQLEGNIYPAVLDACPNAIHTLLIKKECLVDIGLFDEELRHLEDFDFWIRLSKKCRFSFVPKCLVVYHIHGFQMSTNYKMAILGRDIILKKFSNDFNRNKKYLYRHLRRQASKSAITDDYVSFYNYLWLAFMACPLYLGTYIHLFCALISHKMHKRIIIKFGIKAVDGITTF